MAADSMTRREVSSRKHYQVKKAQRTMFFWVAGMSIVVGFCLVLAWFLWQQLVFRTTVVNKKNDTVSRLQSNNEAVPTLKENLRLLEVNEALRSARTNSDERALQVILDALPSTDNSLALGASLQQKLANEIPNLSVESLSTGGDGTAPVDDLADTSNHVPFRLVASSPDVNALKELLRRFERSIRVIDISSLVLDSTGDRYTLTIDAHAYFEPEKTVQLEKKVERP